MNPPAGPGLVQARCRSLFRRLCCLVRVLFHSMSIISSSAAGALVDQGHVSGAPERHPGFIGNGLDSKSDLGRERAAAGRLNIHVYIYIYIYVHIHIHIHTYMYRII